MAQKKSHSKQEAQNKKNIFFAKADKIIETACIQSSPLKHQTSIQMSESKKRRLYMTCSKLCGAVYVATAPAMMSAILYTRLSRVRLSKE